MLYMQYVRDIDVGEWTSEISGWWKGGASRDDILSTDEIVRTISSPSDSLSRTLHIGGARCIDSTPRITHTRVGRIESPGIHAGPIVHACCACSHIVAPEYNATLSRRLGAWEPIRHGKLVWSCNRLVRREKIKWEREGTRGRKEIASGMDLPYGFIWALYVDLSRAHSTRATSGRENGRRKRRGGCCALYVAR